MFGRLKNWWNERRGHSIPKAHAPENIEEFAELLGRSGIVMNQEANQWLALFRAEHPAAGDAPNAIAEFCSFLISRQWITAWQCEKLQSGRWKGFYVEDHYLLLEQVGKGGNEASSWYSSYRACDIRTSNLVCLFIRPLGEGRFDYRVYPYM
jgi:hypothetical protein